MANTETATLVFVQDDGGRKEAGHTGRAGDCVTRAMTIAYQIKFGNRQTTGDLYNSIWHRLTHLAQNSEHGKTADDGMMQKHYDPILKEWGMSYTPLKKRISFQEAYEKYGDCIVHTNRHVAVVTNGQVRDTWDSRWRGTVRNLVRGVYQLGAVVNRPEMPQIDHQEIPHQPELNVVVVRMKKGGHRISAKCLVCNRTRMHTKTVTPRNWSFTEAQLEDWREGTERWIEKLRKQNRLTDHLLDCDCGNEPEPTDSDTLEVRWEIQAPDTGRWTKAVVASCKTCKDVRSVQEFDYHGITLEQLTKLVADFRPDNLDSCQCS